MRLRNDAREHCAASFGLNSCGDIARCVVPSHHGVFSFGTIWLATDAGFRWRSLAKSARSDSANRMRGASTRSAHQRHLHPKVIAHRLAELVLGTQVHDPGGLQAACYSQVINGWTRSSKDRPRGRQLEAIT